MNYIFRCILLIVTFLTSIYILNKVRKSSVKIQDCIFWIYFPIVLLIICCFPNIAVLASKMLGIGTAVNFVFLSIIFLLLLQVFLLSMKVSKLLSKVEELSEEYALDKIENKLSKTEK